MGGRGGGRGGGAGTVVRKAERFRPAEEVDPAARRDRGGRRHRSEVGRAVCGLAERGDVNRGPVDRPGLLRVQLDSGETVAVLVVRRACT